MYSYGILPSIAKIFLEAEHRFCLIHVFENMKLQYKGDICLIHVFDNMKFQYKGDELKEAIWRCEKATSIPRFDMAMKNLKID